MLKQKNNVQSPIWSIVWKYYWTLCVRTQVALVMSSATLDLQPSKLLGSIGFSQTGILQWGFAILLRVHTSDTEPVSSQTPALQAEYLLLSHQEAHCSNYGGPILPDSADEILCVLCQCCDCSARVSHRSGRHSRRSFLLAHQCFPGSHRCTVAWVSPSTFLIQAICQLVSAQYIKVITSVRVQADLPWSHFLSSSHRSNFDPKQADCSWSSS